MSLRDLFLAEWIEAWESELSLFYDTLISLRIFKPLHLLDTPS
jgi:hypothetical protein